MSCSFLITRCESDREGERFACIFYTQDYFNLFGIYSVFFYLENTYGNLKDMHNFPKANFCGQY